MGSSHVFSRLKTRAIKRPSGRVTARTAARKARIWSQPLKVMSELFRPQQRVRQVHEQADRHCQTDDVVERHCQCLVVQTFGPAAYSSRSHAATYATAMRKNASVMMM